MYAFRCNTCGHFEAAGHAGESLHPHACVVCGGGISYNPKSGVKIFDAENWEILSDCSSERLLELGLDGQVERHESCAKSGNTPKVVSATTGNTLGLGQE